MDSTDHKHLQRFCERRKQNKTIGLHKKEYVYTRNIFNLNHWQINKTKEKNELSFGLLRHDPKFTERKTTAESSFLYFAKAWQFWTSCFYLYTSMAIAPALDAHTDNIFLRYCSLFIIKIQLKNHIISSTAPLYNLLHSAWPLCWYAKDDDRCEWSTKHIS